MAIIVVWGFDGQALLKLKTFCPFSYKIGAKC